MGLTVDQPLVDQPKVGIIGTVSLDTLHLADNTSHDTLGGAGLYTALAARCCRIAVTLFAPKPDPLPELLQPVDQVLDWQGPGIHPDDLPRLEIAHHGNGKATLLNASWGAEAELIAEILPDNLNAYRYLHIAALSSAQRQLDFLQAITTKRARQGVVYPHISVGTYARLAYGSTEQVRTLLQQADLFFMNENEANALFTDSQKIRTGADKLLFVTQGEQGALMIDGTQIQHIPAHLATELDPTGAGDTFCGATLANLAQGKTPLAAAQNAVIWAARNVSAGGPSALLTQLQK